MLKSLKIRMFFIVIIFISGLIFIASIQNYFLSKMNYYNEANHAIEKLQIELLQLRRAEKDFYLREDEKYITQFKQIFSQYSKSISNLKKYNDIFSNPDNILTKASTYYELFLKSYKIIKKIGLHQDDGLKAKFRTSVHLLEEELKAKNLLQLSNILLELRRAEKDFFLRKDVHYLLKYEKTFEQLNHLKMEPALLNSFNSYKETFFEISNLMKELGLNEELALRKEIRNIAHEIEFYFEEEINRIGPLLISKTQELKVFKYFIFFIFIMLFIMLYLVSIRPILKIFTQFKLFFANYNNSSQRMNFSSIEFEEFRDIVTTLNTMLEVQNSIEKELRNSRDEALALQKVKSDFLANMSHEIRTPLNAILGFIKILKKKTTEKDALNYINIIDNSGSSLLTIINDILDFSKIQSGQFIIETHPIQTIQEFSDAVILFTSKAYEKHLIYLVYIDPKLPSSIKIDAGRVKQILSNLLSNAIKFTPKYSEIKVSIRHKNSQLTISVQDNGIGISKENQLKIFSSFEQADNSTTRKYGGTGLGLSISSSLANLMDGSLSVESIKGVGSTFTLTIPAQVIESKAVELIDIQHFKELTFALLNNSSEYTSTMKLMKKYLIEFGVTSILEIDNYQKDGYDVLIFIPDDIYNINIIENKVPAIALLRADTIKLASIEHIAPLYTPFVPKSIFQALSEIGIEPKKTPTTIQIADTNDIEFEGSILVAEDNVTNQILIGLILDEYGIKYTIAKDGVEAVAIFKKEKFNMVLMDENMPNMNGIEAMKKIKEYEKEQALVLTPIIALTASALDSDKERFINAGMDGFIAKPINNLLLEEELSKYLKRK